MQIKIKGIMSYPHLFQPRAVQQGDDPKFSCSILLRKDDTQIVQVQQAIDAEKQNGFPSGFPPTGKVCMNDCAVKFPDNPELANFMVINAGASADRKPATVDTNLQPVLDQSLVRAGDIAWFSINTFSYNKSVSKGVAAGLNGVMITGEEGELGLLGNTMTAAQMFGELPAQGGMPAPVAAPAPAPVAAPAPAPVAAPAPGLTMTSAAGGTTYEAYKAQGWTDQQLRDNGLAI